MACQICKIPLGEGDNHSACIVHRKCSRKAPCSFDIEEPGEYWDEVEAVLAAAKCASPERKSSRVAAQGTKQKQVRTSGGSEPPPLAPLSEKKGKKHSTKSKKTDKSSHKRSLPKVNESSDTQSVPRTDAMHGEGQSDRTCSESAEPSPGGHLDSLYSQGVGGDRSIVKVSKPQGGGKSSPRSVNRTPDKQSAKSVMSSDGIRKDGISENNSEASGKKTKTDAISDVSGEVPRTPVTGSESLGKKLKTGEVSDVSGENPKTPIFVPVDIPQSCSRGETQDKDRFHTSSTSQFGPINPPIVFRPQGQPSTSDNRGYFAVQGNDPRSGQPGTSDNRVPFGFQGSNPISGQPYYQPRPVDSQPSHFGYPQWPPYQQPSQSPQWPNSQPPWYPPPPAPCGPFNQWGNYPTTQSQYGSNNNYFTQPQYNIPPIPPPPVVVTTQPSSIATVTTSVAARVATFTPSVASRRKPATVSTAVASVPSRIRKPHTITTPRASPSVGNPDVSDDGIRTGDDTSHTGDDTGLSDMIKLFRDDAPDHDIYDDGDLPDDGFDPQDESIRTRFSRERLLPILKSAGLAANVQCEDEEKPESSLIFGGLGLRHRKIIPVICMPPDVRTTQEEVRKYKGSLGTSKVFNTIFRVPEEDYAEYFTPPAFDEDAAQFFAPLKSKRQDTYLPLLEKDLVGLDREIKVVARLAAFQLIILNSLTIQLSDDVSDEGYDGDSPFAMAKLSAEMAGQQLTQLMRISHATVPMRRANVCAGLAGKHKEDITGRLKDLDLDSERLFAGKFTDALKQTAKKMKREQAIGKVIQSTNTSSYQSRGKGRGASKNTSSFGNARSHPYGNRGKGRGYNQSSGNAGSSYSRGGRNNHQQGGRGQGRGRGRGRPQSRF